MRRMDLDTVLSVGIVLVGVGLLTFSGLAILNRDSRSGDDPPDELRQDRGDPLT